VTVTVITVTAQVTVTAETFNAITALSQGQLIALTVTQEIGCKTTATVHAHTTAILEILHITATVLAIAHAETDRKNYGIFIYTITNS
jgi:hypothetical protein